MKTTLVILVATCAFVFATNPRESKKIHSSLHAKIEADQKANVVVNFIGKNTKALDSIKHLNFKARGDKITALKKALELHAAGIQKNVQYYLKSNSISFKSYWISNQIYIQSATKGVIEHLTTFAEVEDICKEEPAIFAAPEENRQSFQRKGDQRTLWNLEKIQATEAWKITNGTGVVLGVIDLGVRHTHETLKDSFRGVEYGWFDGFGGELEPFDVFGHGTEVTSIAAGRMGVGVAPGSEWIHCAACPGNPVNPPCSGSADGFLSCMQWMMCPTKPDGSSPNCSKAPHVISNSWGYYPGYMEGAVFSRIAAGIVPVFATGNDQYECNNIINPADMKETIAVGNTNINDHLSYRSNAGPAPGHMEIKPEVTAPGQDIISGWFAGDDVYTEATGTSLSTPHVAGTIALLLSVKPNLTVAEAKEYLIQSGVETATLRSRNRSCGGIEDTVFPNYIFGYGRINALKLVQSAINRRM